MSETKSTPTLFTHPIKTVYIFSKVLASLAHEGLSFLVRFWYVVALVLLVTVVPRFVAGSHSQAVEKADQIGYFVLYWIILGVASSIGLGTGLHTFVLYLGPHIAKQTLFSYECNALPVAVPSKYNAERYECPHSGANGVTFLDILLSVQFEAFLWGFGTALGELPPYFVARAAALANQKSAELEEVEQTKDPKTLMDRAKVLIYKQLQRHAFITVFLCASIPNPLFDLAGITCGHFLIPFATFFLATSLGKAVVKVHIQMVFVILTFSKEHVDSLVELIGKYLPFLRNTITNSLEKQRALLKDPASFQEGEKPLIAQLWDYFILAMILYFLVSIVNSSVANYLAEESPKPTKQSQPQKSKSPNQKKRE